MKLSLLVITAALGLLLSAADPGLNASPETVQPAGDEAFSGRLVFHQKDGQLTYDLTITEGQVTGTQHFGDAAKPAARVVGGWFDLQQGTLSLLIQANEAADPKWRAQAQHFRIDVKAKQVTLEHALFGYGLTKDNTPIYADHVLDTLDRIEHLARQQ